MTSLRRFDSPIAPMTIAAALSTVFAVLRWFDAAHKNLAEFIDAGSIFVNGAKAPKGLPIRAGFGYNGEFYYRLALDPFDMVRTAFGIRFHAAYFPERIGYPFFAWLLSRGQHELVPLTLVIANVLGCAVVGFAGGLLAKSANRHSLWGLVFSCYWGYLWTIGLDLTELTTAAFVMLGIVALIRHAPIWGSFAFLAAVLCKESAIWLVSALAIMAIWEKVRHRDYAIRRNDLTFTIPLVGFGIWQLVLLGVIGRLPILTSGQANLGIPFVGLFGAIAHNAATLPTGRAILSVLWFGEFIVFLVLGISAARALKSAPVTIRWLWGAYVVLDICASSAIWYGHVGFRSLGDFYLVSWVVLLYRPVSPWRLAVLCGGVWFVEALQLILRIPANPYTCSGVSVHPSMKSEVAERPTLL